MGNKKYEIYSTVAEMWKGDGKYFQNIISFHINWVANVGFGDLEFSYNTETNEWDVESEYMDEEFCQAVLNKWLHGIYSGEEKFQKLER